MARRSAAAPACPLCSGGTVVAFVTRDRNRAVTGDSFEYRRCGSCGALHLADVPADLSAFYPAEYFGLPSADGLRAAARAEAYRLAIVERHVRGGRLVEIGPGNGIFAVQAVDAGYHVTGIEMDPVASRHLRETLGIDVVESSEPEVVLGTLPPSAAIVAWHVLEHVREPWAVLETAAANLQAGGALVVATPNPAAFGFRVLGARWPHVDAPRHLFLIPPAALIARARRHGLQPVELTHDDPGGRRWNAFSWHYLLRRPGASYVRERAAGAAGAAIALALAPIERRGMRGAAYTVVLRKR